MRVNQHQERHDQMVADTTGVHYDWQFYIDYDAMSGHHRSSISKLMQLGSKSIKIVGPIHDLRLQQNELLGIPIADATTIPLSGHSLAMMTQDPASIVQLHLIYDSLKDVNFDSFTIEVACIKSAFGDNKQEVIIGVDFFDVKGLHSFYGYAGNERFFSAIDGAMISDRAAILMSIEKQKLFMGVDVILKQMNTIQSNYATGYTEYEEYYEQVRNYLKRISK